MPERPVNNSSVEVARFAAELRALRTAAGLPSFRVMAGKAHFAPSTLAEATRGVRLPSRAVVEAFAKACDADPAEWAIRWKEFSTGQVRSATPEPQPVRWPRILPLATLVVIGIVLNRWIRRDVAHRPPDNDVRA
jgi:transcriptional regulator with XRE-family HTH domain